jgi:hypothetical protein
MQFSSASCHFLPPGSTNLLRNLFSNTLNYVHLLERERERETKFHTHTKPTGEIITLIFKFLYRYRKAKYCGSKN